MANTRNDVVRQHNREVMKRALRIEDVAYSLDCCKKTVYEEIKRKRLRAFRVGSEFRILPQDLDAYIQARSA